MRPTLFSLIVTLFIIAGCQQSNTVPSDLVHEPYRLDTGLISRSISFENPTGAPGAGGTAAHENMGVGRKGAPKRPILPGETVQLADITGPGTVRHIWLTTWRTPVNFRSLVIRVYYDGQEHPSIECPLGDLFGFAHGKHTAYQSAVHSVGERAGLNLWLPMPFKQRFRMTITNDGERQAMLYYQVDYTINDQLPEDVGALHVLFRRENPTTLKEDFELLPKRMGKGRFIGAVMGIRNLNKGWWGEGEIKIYMDGDTEFPTICGTGSEDYVGLSWGMQQTPFLYNGCSLSQNEWVSMYRWHLPDPIYWQEECRITIQQIGAQKPIGLHEQVDDWSTATFWYEPIPSAPLPPMPSVGARTANIWTEPKEDAN
jgi:hypothetical protein